MKQCKEALRADLLPGTTQPYSVTMRLLADGVLHLPDAQDYARLQAPAGRGCLVAKSLHFRLPRTGE